MDFATHNAALGENTKHGGGFYYPYFDGVELRKIHPSYNPKDEY